MVYNSEIEQMFGEEVFPRRVNLAATVRDLRESRGNKRTHFKLDSNVGRVAWKDFVVVRMDDQDQSTRTYNHRISVNGFVMTKIKNPSVAGTPPFA